MKRRHRPLALVLGVLLLVGVATAGAGIKATEGRTATKLVIGISNPMSGPAALYGELGYGMKAYLDYTNDRGGVNGYTFDVKLLDSAESAAGGAATVRRLLGEDPFLVEVTGSSPFQAAISVLKSEAPELPVFSMSNAAVIAKSGLRNAYGVYPNYTRECYFHVDFAVKKLKRKNIAIVYEDDAVGQGAGANCPGYAKRNGASSVTAIALPPTTTDFGAIAARIKDSKAQVVLIYALAGLVAGTQKAGAAVGYNGAWVTFSSNFDDSYVQIAGSASEGTYVDSWLEPLTSGSPEANLFNTEIRNRRSQATSTLGAAGWTTGAVVVSAIRDATRGGKQLTQASFFRALNSIKNRKIGLAPSVTYTGRDHTTFVRNLAVYRVVNGKFRLVAAPAPVPAH